MLVAILAAGCGNRKAEQFKALPFPDIQLPAVIQTEQAALDYMAEHFWDNLTETSRTYPCDSVHVSGVSKDAVEQKFANWLYLIEKVDLKTAEKSVRRLCSRAIACEKADTSSNVLNTVTFLADKYLYNPNSPLRNEEFYLYFASAFASFDGFSDEERDRYSFQAEGCSLNRIGQKAADFRFTDNRGKTYTLHGIDSPYVLLFFSNPGCEACLNIINMLKSDQQVEMMTREGMLTVLNIYIDEDLQGWKDYMTVYPKEWYNCFDPDLAIRTDNLYNVRAIPSLYVLDKEKRVILKDAPEQKVLSYLTEL